MKKMSLSPFLMRVIVVALLLILLTVPASSAEIAREDLGYSEIIRTSYNITRGWGGTISPRIEIKFMNGVEYFNDFKMLYLGDLQSDCVLNPAENTSASTPFTTEDGELEGILHYNVHFKDNLPYKVQIWVTIDKFAPTGTGTKRYILLYDNDAVSYLTIKGRTRADTWPATPFVAFSTSEIGYPIIHGDYIAEYVEKFEHEYVLTEYEHEYVLDVFRHNYKSRIELRDDAYDYLQIPDEGLHDFRREIPKLTLNPPIYLNITDLSGKEFNRVFLASQPTPTEPTPTEDASVTVYVKNSQTGALIANANIAIDALVNGEYYPVTNRTEPSGIFNINLQPTGGGQPNPDGYRLIVTADGYNNPMPEINFTVDDYKQSIYCLLDPIAGGPVNENKTFIDFFVRDMSSNPISGATVKFGKYTLITNSAGYTVFEVDKNNNYTWIISKSGYGPLTGNAVIGDAPRHNINTVLAPIVTPPTQTPIPTGTEIGPTPTMTAPTGEPVSNWLEWFAAHFGMILGGGAEIGKIFMWLCFAVPVGVYVGKEAKAGAAGFMAGAGIVTLFFALIGWVPIWLVVLLALIIGLLYAKVFNTPDNGGGR